MLPTLLLYITEIDILDAVKTSRQHGMIRVLVPTAAAAAPVVCIVINSNNNSDPLLFLILIFLVYGAIAR